MSYVPALKGDVLLRPEAGRPAFPSCQQDKNGVRAAPVLLAFSPSLRRALAAHARQGNAQTQLLRVRPRLVLQT